jgi:iron complex outermembrane receptor protein
MRRQLTAATILTSLTAVRKLDYDAIADTDITELDLTASHNHEQQHQISEEVTIAQQGTQLTAVGGVFLFHEVDRQPSYVEFGSARLQNFLEPAINTRTGAGFAQGTYALTRRASVTAGLRYTFERKDFTNTGWSRTFDVPVRQISSYAYTDGLSRSAWTPKFGMEFRPAANGLLYVSATRGFKSGGFNPTSTTPRGGYAPEWAWSYEGGWKVAAADNRSTFNGAVFWTDYIDLQVQTTIIPGVIDISNAARATIRGFEVEGKKRVGDDAQLGANLSWLDARYDRYIAVGVNGVTGDAAGRRLTNAPQWSGHLWIDWTRNVGHTHAISFRADTTWQSTVFFTPFNDEIQRQPPYGLVDVSADFVPAHRSWSIGAYAKNLTSTAFITASFSSPIPAIGARPGVPRQAGIRFVLTH